MTIADALDVITKGGLVGMLVCILWAGMTERWVWGWVHRQALADRDVASAAALAAAAKAMAEALAARDAEIVRLQQEKDELWQFALKATGILDRTTEAASRGANAAALLARRSQAAGE